MNPWPGAFCHLKQQGKEKTERIILLRADLAALTDDTEVAETTIAGTVAEDMSIHGTTGRLRLLEVKPKNGRRMGYADFVNGRHLQKGDRFLDGTSIR